MSNSNGINNKKPANRIDHIFDAPVAHGAEQEQIVKESENKNTQQRPGIEIQLVVFLRDHQQPAVIPCCIIIIIPIGAYSDNIIQQFNFTSVFLLCRQRSKHRICQLPLLFICHGVSKGWLARVKVAGAEQRK